MSARRSTRSYALTLVSAAFVYGAQQLLPDAYARAVLANLAWTGAALGAILGSGRAVRWAKRSDRAAWVFVAAGAVAWFVGQFARAMSEVAGAPVPRMWIDVGFLLAAPLWTIGLVLILRRHGQRLALYALVLDISAVVLLLAAGLMVYLSGLLVPIAGRDPGFAAVALLYPLLYATATAAALSVVWGMPATEPRGAVMSLFVGLGLNALAFALYVPSYLQSTFGAGTPVDALWIVGVAAIGIAGAQWIEEDSRVDAGTALSSSAIEFSRMLLPGLVAAASAFLLIYTDMQALPRPVSDFVDAAVALTVLVLAIRAGIALFANWRLGERERRRAEQMAALYDVGLATAGELSLADLAALIAREATALTRTDGAMVSLAERGDGFVVRAQHNAPALGLRASVGEALRGVALDAVRTRELVIATDYRAHPDSNPLLHDVIASAIAAPLIAHGELVGTLTAYARQRRVFSEETRRLVRLYAAQAAIAIANADLVAETRRLARDDDLTGVLNRRSLMERLESEIAEAARHGDIFGVVLCDLDGLKAVNDSAGHLVGNEVLKTVARTMRESARVEDVIARFGGDEFVLLLPRTGPLPAQALVGRIAARLRDEHYMWAGRPNPLPRVSFGIAWFPEDGRDADALIGAADARMYEDKGRERSRRESGAAEAD